jgi:error-prone DNA polymerase
MKLLAAVAVAADALASLPGHRRQQIWEAAAWRSTPKLLRDAPVGEDYLELPGARRGGDRLGLRLDRIDAAPPSACAAPTSAAKRGFKAASELTTYRNGQMAHACGIVTLRQQPDTANGTIFVSLEDETVVQVIYWRRVRENQRAATAVAADGPARHVAARGGSHEPDRRPAPRPNAAARLNRPGNLGGSNS